MTTRLFHIYRNTPMGRETLLQTAHFCRLVDAAPVVYIPESPRFLMYFDDDVVQVDLDDSYLACPETAMASVEEILAAEGLVPRFYKVRNRTTDSLPDIPVDFDYMACPASIRDLSAKFGFGFVGNRVNRLVRQAHFPVLVPGLRFSPWKSMTVCFGGQENGIQAVRLGLQIARAADMPLDLVTQKEGGVTAKGLEAELDEAGLGGLVADRLRKWHWYEDGRLADHIRSVDPQSLVVMGAFGHGRLYNLFFGSHMERVQRALPNPILLAGPHLAFLSRP